VHWLHRCVSKMGTAEEIAETAVNMKEYKSVLATSVGTQVHDDESQVGGC